MSERKEVRFARPKDTERTICPVRRRLGGWLRPPHPAQWNCSQASAFPKPHFGNAAAGRWTDQEPKPAELNGSGWYVHGPTEKTGLLDEVRKAFFENVGLKVIQLAKAADFYEGLYRLR